ncbi:MAG TPA: zinc-binding alcohol dehydrogenase family protein [Cyclobacteriaceae bacterium]
MKAYLLKKAGHHSVLKHHTVDSPTIKPGHVRIKIKYIGLNYAEILARRGQYGWAPKKPFIPGMEGMGEIMETGNGVEALEVGSKVIFGAQYGSYAEEIVVPQHLAFPVISTMTDEENAAFLVNFITAWVSLFRLGKLQPEETVLIQAAAGGVGTAAVQLAAKAGANVVGLAGSQEKLTLVADLGAHQTINYRKDSFYEILKEEGVDVVLEVVGGDVFLQSIRLLKPYGRMVVAGYASIPLKKWNPFTWWPAWKNAPKAKLMKMAKKSIGIFATHVGYLINNRDLVKKEWTELTDFVKQHDIKPVVGKTFEFDDLPQAHQWIESRKSVGKVLVKVDD